MGVTATFQRMMHLGLQLSCDNVLKSDWYCYLSGSRSNSFNSRKLPGCFSYSPRMRLRKTQLSPMGHESFHPSTCSYQLTDGMHATSPSRKLIGLTSPPPPTSQDAYLVFLSWSLIFFSISASVSTCIEGPHCSASASCLTGNLIAGRGASLHG